MLRAVRPAVAWPLRHRLRGVLSRSLSSSLPRSDPEAAGGAGSIRFYAAALGLVVFAAVLKGTANKPVDADHSGTPFEDLGVVASSLQARLNSRLQARDQSGKLRQLVSSSSVPPFKVYRVTKKAREDKFDIKPASAVAFHLPDSVNALEPLTLLSHRLAASRGPFRMRPMFTSHTKATGFALVFKDDSGSVFVRKRAGLGGLAKVVVTVDDVCNDQDGFSDDDLDTVLDAYVMVAFFEVMEQRRRKSRRSRRRKSAS